MARPRKNENEKRVQAVTIRFTRDEYAIIKKQSQASVLSPANWMRHKIFTGKFPPMRVSPVEVSLYKELRKIGVNLNQGTHKLNQGDFPAHYRELQIELLEKLDTIYNVLIKEEK